jgi:hypothetical protein
MKMKKNDWCSVVFTTVTTCLLLSLLTMFIASVAAGDCKPNECLANCDPGIFWGCRAIDPRMDSCGQAGDETRIVEAVNVKKIVQVSVVACCKSLSAVHK